jgi:predicted site-specific integrase-resolvase
VTLNAAGARADVTPATLRRWIREGLVKTIGDEVMVIGSDAAALTYSAVVARQRREQAP